MRNLCEWKRNMYIRNSHQTDTSLLLHQLESKGTQEKNRRERATPGTNNNAPPFFFEK